MVYSKNNINTKIVKLWIGVTLKSGFLVVLGWRGIARVQVGIGNIIHKAFVWKGSGNSINGGSIRLSTFIWEGFDFGDGGLKVIEELVDHFLSGLIVGETEVDPENNKITIKK